MRKHVLALLFAAVALVTFTTTSMAQRWGWPNLDGPRAWVSDSQSMVPLGEIDAYVGPASGAAINVVPVDLDPAALRTPGVFAEVLPALEEVLAAIRVVVADDPVLVTNLKTRGLSTDDVIGLTHSPDGVTLFVSNA